MRRLRGMRMNGQGPARWLGALRRLRQRRQAWLRRQAQERRPDGPDRD